MVFIAVGVIIGGTLTMTVLPGSTGFAALTADNTEADEATGMHVSAKVESYLNTNFLAPQGAEADMTGVTDFSTELYEINFNITGGTDAGQTGTIYATKDGSYVFLSAPYDMRLPVTIPQPEPQPQPPQVEVDMEALAEGGHVKGEEDAPVTIIEFSDFECIFCASFYTGALQEINTQYIETGQVKLVYKHFPLLSRHPNAQKAAEAAECAAEQEKFWEMHDTIFENQTAIGVAALKGYAEDLGLDTAQFNECLDSGKYAQKVMDDLALGSASGVSGTPGFFINGDEVSGAQPFANFQAIIEKHLAE